VSPEIQFVALMAGTFVGGVAAGLAGFAYALVTSAIFLHAMNPRDAVAVMMIGSILAQGVTIWRFRASIDRGRLLPFLLPGILGVPLGTWLLTSVDAEVVRDAVGVFLVCYATYGLGAPPLRVPDFGGRIADGAVGFAGGILGGLAGLSGALPTIWSSLRGWTRDQQRAVYQPFIVVVQIWGLGSLALAGGVGRGALEWVAMSLPAFVGGVFLGMRAYARIDERRFRHVVLVLLLASGIALVLF
jgi:uncharacterized membrane protein YfcA